MNIKKFYEVNLYVGEEKCFNEENHDLLLKLVNQKYKEIASRCKVIMESSPVYVSEDDLICVFVDMLRQKVLNLAMSKLFDYPNTINLNEAVKSCITEEMIDEAIVGDTSTKAFLKVLENKCYENAQQKIAAVNFVKKVKAENNWL